MKSILAQRIRAARQAINPEVTQRDVAKRLEVSPSAVNLRKAGKTEPNATNIVELSRWFQVSCDWLLGAADSKLPNAGPGDAKTQMNAVPVVQSSALTRWHWDRVESLLQTAEFYPNQTAAAMVVNGDAMSTVCPPGSMAVVSKGQTPHPGSVVLAVVGSSVEPVLRHLVRDGGVDLLMADDTRYPTTRLDEGARIIGVVTEVTTRKNLVR